MTVKCIAFFKRWRVLVFQLLGPLGNVHTTTCSPQYSNEYKNCVRYIDVVVLVPGPLVIEVPMAFLRQVSIVVVCRTLDTHRLRAAMSRHIICAYYPNRNCFKGNTPLAMLMFDLFTASNRNLYKATIFNSQ